MSEPEPVFTVESTARLAQEAHIGQVDKQGRDYFTAHLVPAADALTSFGAEAVMAGYLHDALEDTDHTPDSLTARGVPARVVEAVVAVTRVPGEPYAALIERARAHPLGRIVKLADNAVNIASNPGLAAHQPESARALLNERYLPARQRLLDGLADADIVLETITQALRGAPSPDLEVKEMT
ncbi:MAG: hypothetical protein ACRCYU_17665 [Nocardioides sp.]